MAKLSLYPILMISFLRKLKFIASVVSVLVSERERLLHIIALPIIGVYIYAVLEFGVLKEESELNC